MGVMKMVMQKQIHHLHHHQHLRLRKHLNRRIRQRLRLPLSRVTNVALNAAFEVSSHTGETHTVWGWHASFINDGNTEFLPYENVGWTTQVGIIMTEEDWWDQWVLFDIGGELLIDKVVLYPIEGLAPFFPIDYHVEVSTDNSNYTTVISVVDDFSTANEDDSPKELKFDPVVARYVRVVFTKPYNVPNADGYLVQLAEIEIYTAEENQD